MSRRKAPRLTPALQQRIVAAIRAGGYPHIAAEAAGVSMALFDDWLRRGQGDGASEPHRSFAAEVREARAQARLRAEAELFDAEPKRWLIQGPGRDGVDNPGWSVAVKPAAGASKGPNALLDPAFLEVVNDVLEALTLFPDAHRHMSQLPRVRGLSKAA